MDDRSLNPPQTQSGLRLLAAAVAGVPVCAGDYAVKRRLEVRGSSSDLGIGGADLDVATGMFRLSFAFWVHPGACMACDCKRFVEKTIRIDIHISLTDELLVCGNWHTEGDMIRRRL
jgi:hypothetical protein